MQSESTAKTVFLVIFFLLWVTSTVFWYMAWDQNDNARIQKAEAEKLAKDSEKNLNDMKQNYNRLRELMDATNRTEDDYQAVHAIYKNYLEKPKLDADRIATKPKYQTFTDGIDWLSSELAAADVALKTKQKEFEELETKFKQIEAQYTSERDVLKNSKDQLASEFQERDDKFKRDLDLKDQEISSIRRKLTNIGLELEQKTLEYEEKQRDFDDAINFYQLQIANLTKFDVRKLLNTTSLSADQEKLIAQIEEIVHIQSIVEFVQEDGEITQVNAANKTAIINLGSSDGIQKGQTFSVYGTDASGHPYQMPKAKIEVLRVLDEDESLVRIANETIKDLVTRGDKIHNPLWSPGELMSIAIAGEIFLDLDEKEDTKEFMKFVKDSNAKIDAWWDVDRMQVRGEITHNTDWLVIGDAPQLDTATHEVAVAHNERVEKIQKGIAILTAQARSNNVRIINLRNFLVYLGKSTPQRLVKSGEENSLLRKRRERFFQERDSMFNIPPGKEIFDPKGSN